MDTVTQTKPQVTIRPASRSDAALIRAKPPARRFWVVRVPFAMTALGLEPPVEGDPSHFLPVFVDEASCRAWNTRKFPVDVIEVGA